MPDKRPAFSNSIHLEILVDSSSVLNEHAGFVVQHFYEATGNFVGLGMGLVLQHFHLAFTQ